MVMEIVFIIENLKNKWVLITTLDYCEVLSDMGHNVHLVLQIPEVYDKDFPTIQKYILGIDELPKKVDIVVATDYTSMVYACQLKMTNAVHFMFYTELKPMDEVEEKIVKYCNDLDFIRIRWGKENGNSGFRRIKESDSKKEAVFLEQIFSKSIGGLPAIRQEGICLEGIH